MSELFELDEARIRELAAEEKCTVSARAEDFFDSALQLLVLFLDEYHWVLDGRAEEAELSVLQEHNDALYADILPEHYGENFANPAYCALKFGTEYGKLAAAFVYELRSMIPFLYEGNEEEIRIRLELFLEVYTAFSVEEEQYRTFKENGGNPEEAGLTGIPPLKSLRSILHSYVQDYLEQELSLEVEHKLVGENADYHDLLLDILKSSDLSDPRYLYRTGEYITDNELRTWQHLQELSEDEIGRMADTWTEGYRIGFITGGKDLDSKKRVGLIWHLGFERMILRSLHNFEAMDKTCICYRETQSLFGLHEAERTGCCGADANPQYRYDHREDLALLLDDDLAGRRVEALAAAYRRWKEETVLYAGPAVMEVFGEAPFAPVSGAAKTSFDKGQQKLISRFRQIASRYYNDAVIGKNRSFTIISFPLPSIEEGNPKGAAYEDIFDAVLRINTLDYETYQRIQSVLIAALDRADRLHVTGRSGNPTDLTVNLWKLNDPSRETIFENCVADVNIPVGEVFTSPVLKGTEGVLAVSGVYLEGLFFKNLSLTFEDGCICDYSCDNFAGEENGPEKGRAYIEENILFHHKTLPMGECAIGTNTTAYAEGIRYGITDRLPILIAEKTGPHFAVGDTCYSDEEENESFNPDGKRIVAKENDFSRLRESEPEKAYFGCHTDITIPFAELGGIEAIHKDGTSEMILENGRFVLPGTEELNAPLDSLKEN